MEKRFIETKLFFLSIPIAGRYNSSRGATIFLDGVTWLHKMIMIFRLNDFRLNRMDVSWLTWHEPLVFPRAVLGCCSSSSLLICKSDKTKNTAVQFAALCMSSPKENLHTRFGSYSRVRRWCLIVPFRERLECVRGASVSRGKRKPALNFDTHPPLWINIISINTYHT